MVTSSTSSAWKLVHSRGIIERLTGFFRHVIKVSRTPRAFCGNLEDQQLRCLQAEDTCRSVIITQAN